DGDLHHDRDLLVFEPLLVAEDTATPHLVGEVLERRPEVLQALPPENLLFGAQIWSCDLQCRARSVVALHRRVERLFAPVTLLRPASPELVQVDVVRDLPQPPLEPRLTSKGVYTLKDPKKDFLGEILAFLDGKALAQKERMNERPEPAEKLFEVLFHADSRLDLPDKLDKGVVVHRIRIHQSGTLACRGSEAEPRLIMLRGKDIETCKYFDPDHMLPHLLCQFLEYKGFRVGW